MEPPLTPTTKSLVSIGTNTLYVVNCFTFFKKRKHITHLLTKATTWAERITDPHITSVPPGAFQQRSFRFRLWRLFQVTSLNNGSGIVLSSTNGGEKNCCKAFHQLCHDSQIWGLLFCFSDVLFFCWGGGWGWKGVNFRGFTPPIDSTNTSSRNEDMWDMWLALKKDL